jgi:hypothetical protein
MKMNFHELAGESKGLFPFVTLVRPAYVGELSEKQFDRLL